MNPSKTASVPLTGWMVYDSNIKDFHKDTSVKIKFGELTEDDISGKVRVQLQGAFRDPICEGVYEMTDRYIALAENLSTRTSMVTYCKVTYWVGILLVHEASS